MTQIDIDGVRLHHRVEGRDHGPALLLSNSLGTDLHLWDRQLDTFRSAFRVIRYDGRGQGRSDSPSGVYTIEELGSDALWLLDSLGIDRAHVCGLSLGGLVAQWLAVHHPDRIDRLVLAATAPRIGTPDRWQERVDAVRAGGMAAVADHVVQTVFFSPGFAEREPEVVEAAKATLLATDPEGYIGSCLALRDTDLHGLVASIRAPTLVLVGADDPSTPVEEARTLSERIENSRLVVIPNAAHLCNVEQPAPFAREVVRFLTR